MSVTLTTPDSTAIENPDEADLENALKALFAHEDEDADLWLEHDSGWTISVVKDGDLFLEDLESEDEEEYWTLDPQPQEETFSILNSVARGEIEAVRQSYQWQKGE